MPKTSITEVLNHFYNVNISERAGWQKVLCPLHVEDRPSASVNSELQRWSCFVCDVSEDSYDVIQREMGIGYRQAQEFAHSRFGGGGEDVRPAVRGKPGAGIHGGPGAGKRRPQVQHRIRPFGANGP
ncbi:CHC2 zinc finger domain-containing protein [Streptomyces sp. NPDC003444]